MGRAFFKLTPNQKQAIIEAFNNPNKLKVRNKKKSKKSFYNKNNKLNNESTFQLSGELSFFKINDEVDGDVITGAERMTLENVTN